MTTDHQIVDTPVTRPVVSVRAFINTAAASQVAKRASIISTQARPLPQTDSTTETMPRPPIIPAFAAMNWTTKAKRALKTTTHRKSYPNLAPARDTLAMVAGPQATALMIQAGPICLMNSKKEVFASSLFASTAMSPRLVVQGPK